MKVSGREAFASCTDDGLPLHSESQHINYVRTIKQNHEIHVLILSFFSVKNIIKI